MLFVQSRPTQAVPSELFAMISLTEREAVGEPSLKRISRGIVLRALSVQAIALFGLALAFVLSCATESSFRGHPDLNTQYQLALRSSSSTAN